MIPMSETNMIDQKPSKINITIRMTQYAANRLVKLAGKMGMSKSIYVEQLVRQTHLGEHKGVTSDVYDR